MKTGGAPVFLDESEAKRFLSLRFDFWNESEVIHMLTFQDLIAFTALLVGIVGLVIMTVNSIHDKKK